MKLKFSFKDMSIRAKLAIAISVPIIGLILLIGHNTIDGINLIKDLNNVRNDITIMTKAGALIHELQREGGMAQLYLGSKAADDLQELKAQRAETDKHLAVFRSTVDSIDASRTGAGPTEAFQTAKKKVDTLISRRADIDEFKISQPELLQQLGDTLNTLLAAEQKIRHERAAVDPDIANAARTYVTLVEAKIRAGQTRAAGVVGFSTGQFTPEAFQTFTARVADTNKQFDYLFEIASPTAKEIWTKAYSSNELKTMHETINRVIQLGAGASLPFSADEWFRMATARANKLKTVEDAFVAELEKTTSYHTTSEYWITGIEIGGTLTLTLLTFALGYMVYRGLMASVNDLSETVGGIAKGNYDTRAKVLGGDEMGMLAMALNQMLDDRVQALAKTQKENETLNNSVVDLLKAVFVLSQRDLTTRCGVDETVIGTVADSINQLTIETAKVLGQVTQAANRVGRASEKVKSQASSVSMVAEDELKSVNTMTEDIGKTVEQVSAMADLASDTNKSAEEATASTNEALDRVSDTVKGMEAIRENIAETEKRIKRLGERSQEITGIVNLINTISERTHVLALNASMQAAIAGEAGRGFAVVAEEVQRLAESSRNATSQIAALVNNIQIETNDTVATVNKTISQVVSESELARKAGSQMEKTQRITAQLAEMVQKIAASAQVQAQSAQFLRQKVEQIGAGAMQTREQIAAQNEETKLLEATARQLLDTISVFKLPQDVIDSANDTQSITGSLPKAA